MQVRNREKVLLSKADLDWQILIEKRLDQLTSLLKTLSRRATLWSIRVWQFLGNFRLRMLLKATSRDLIWLQEMSQRTPPYNDRQWELKRTVLT